jgi:putative membrane protein
MYMDWHGWGMGGGWLFMVLFWGLVIAAIVAVVVSFTRKSGGNGTKSESAMEILKKRYAKGEITKEQYDNMKKDIDGQ